MILRSVILCALLTSAGHAARLELDFLHEAGTKPLVRDSVRYRTTEGETFSITRLDWLADGFSLTTGSGKTVTPVSATAFVPSRGGSLSLGDLPADEYTAISFHIGPDPQANHGNPAAHPAGHPLNPNVNGLHWDWQGGYIFMAIEGHWRAPGRREHEGYAYHFATDAYRTRVTLPVELDLRDATRLAVALDVEKLLGGLSFSRDGATTHSRPGDPVADRIRENIGGSFRIAAVTRGGIPKPAEPLVPIDLPANPTPYAFRLPKDIPLPALPLDNPLIEERVKLGEALFHETSFSRDGSLSCASCHQQEHAFSDPRRVSAGVGGRLGTRNSMPLANLAWKERFFWDGRAPSLREQVLMPIEDHREMDESLDRVVRKLRDNPVYPPLFAAAFGSGEITAENIALAMENHLLTITGFDSKFDRARKGKETLTSEEQRGMRLFFTENEPRLGSYGADCFHCHGGAMFTDHGFHHNGIETEDDTGLERSSGDPADRFKFATPSLRNVALTAPYMHDGRFATLEEVVAHYNQEPVPGETLDPNIAKHRGGLNLPQADQAALVAFLKTLTSN